MTKQHCSGCRDDFYNGNNPYGVRECWHFKTAKLVKRLHVPINLRPPYKMKPTMTPACKHVDGYSMVNPESIGLDGYWKA